LELEQLLAERHRLRPLAGYTGLRQARHSGHENIGRVVSRNGRRLMMVARVTPIQSLPTPLTRTLQQQFCDCISCFGFGGPGLKLEHFRGVEWVYHLHNRTLRLRISCRRRGYRDSECDGWSGRLPDQDAPPDCRGDSQNERDERQCAHEVDPFRSPAYEAVVPELERHRCRYSSQCTGGLRKLELLSGSELQVYRVVARIPSVASACWQFGLSDHPDAALSI
jgi:hypothetical protein